MRLVLFILFTLAVAGLAATGCGRLPASSYVDDYSAIDNTVDDCLAAMVTLHDDRRAQGPAIAYRFSNRCRHPITIDLRRARVAVNAGADSVVLTPFDPNRELGEGVVDGAAAGYEVIEYQVSSAFASGGRLCVDLSRLRSASGNARSVVQCVSTGAMGDVE